MRKQHFERDMQRYFPRQSNLIEQRSLTGFSLIEVLVAVTILILVSMIGMRFIQSQLASARDGQRKSDLHDLRTAFENYYNDVGEYPPQDILQNCDSEALKPYMATVPCDPNTVVPYVYAPYPSSADRSGGYRIYTILERATDPDIEKSCGVGCNVPAALGGSNAADYNYGISVGVPIVYN